IVGSTNISRSSAKWRWALVIAGFALLAGGTAWWLWPRRPDRDPMRLGTLRAALDEFNAGRHERAEAILARREAEGVRTSLAWMLRARVAGGRGRRAGALGDLAHIPDTDRIGAQARLKAGQIERARNRLRAAESEFLRALAIEPGLAQSHR